ncbi:MAG TPA: alpha/beta hydrolase [Sphingopyxis sp.]|nr:alpha/beta hydrolase [Sphingopyxis sp.]
MTVKLFLHGVPDSPAIWRPLLALLQLEQGQAFTPALPGFVEPLPPGFSATKEGYLQWLIAEMERLAADHGPIDVVGHDWGAILVQRAAMLRPDLVRSWIISNAVIEPEYRGHRMARIWNTPILGEIFMALARPARLAQSLKQAGIPAEIADEEAAQWNRADKKRAILRLYRSAEGLSFAGNWARDIDRLPAAGALIWGVGDPFVTLDVAQRYHKRTGTPLFPIEGAGHWAIAERPMQVAETMKDFWKNL